MADRAVATGMRVPRSVPAPDMASRRLDRAFRKEVLTGLRLAMWVRCAALVVIMVLVAVQNLSGGANLWFLYYEALILVFGALSVAQYLTAKARGGDIAFQYLFVVLDAALLVFTVVCPNPFAPFEQPIPMFFRWGNFPYFFVLAGGVMLSYAPWLVLWNGLVVAVLWSVAFWVVAGLPGSVVLGLGFSLTDSEGYRGLFLGAETVVVTRWLQETVVYLIFSGVLAGIVWRARHLVRHQANTERERTNLARYFSPNLVEDLAHSDQPLGAVRRQDVAVLFADIVGFTRLSENAPPETVIGLLRDFHGRMEATVFDHGGTLDKYIGDAVMATFGTPRTGPRDAIEALACARAMLDALAAWNDLRLGAGEPPVEVGIGLHYGPVVVGDIGGEHRLEFAVIGDTVNVASRLERLTRSLGARLVVSEDLVQAAQAADPGETAALLDGFVARAPHEIRGREASLPVRTLGPD